MLQIFKIGETFQPNSVDGRLLKTKSHDNVYGAYTYEYQIKKDRLFVSIMSGKLHEVTYVCPRAFPWSRRSRNKFLFTAYGTDGDWKQILKSGSGRMFRSENDLLFASWTKASDTLSFGTMIFHEEKYRIIT